MAAAKNKVIAGDYDGWDVVTGGGKLHLMHRLTKVELTNANVDRCDVITSQSGSSFWGTFLRGYVGNAILGPAGLMASTVGAAGKQTILLSIEFKGGMRSLLEVDDKTYKKIIKALY